jgi:hypothetical protein
MSGQSYTVSILPMRTPEQYPYSQLRCLIPYVLKIQTSTSRDSCWFEKEFNCNTYLTSIISRNKMPSLPRDEIERLHIIFCFGAPSRLTKFSIIWQVRLAKGVPASQVHFPNAVFTNDGERDGKMRWRFITESMYRHARFLSYDELNLLYLQWKDNTNRWHVPRGRDFYCMYLMTLIQIYSAAP